MDNRRFRNDRNERNGISDQGKRTAGAAGAVRPERRGEPGKGGRFEKAGRIRRNEITGRTEKAEKGDRGGGFERTDELDRLEGRNSVLEALKAGRSINRILVAKGEREGSVNQIVALARQNHIVLQEVDRMKLDGLSSTHAHQGVIAFAAAKDYVEVDDILELAAESGRPPFLVVLDEITDAYNLGSILRTADAAGVHGIIIPKRRAVGLTAAVSKASAGAIEYVPVARVTNIAQTIEYLKKKNIWVVGADSTGEKPFFQSDLKGPVALVVGSEGEGMGKLVRESCDFTVNIPMLGRISSLNAAIAGAIVMYEILRQRSK
jgi:23S rRNA (guanosine2251-2'-O)-methyltransferase